MCIRLLLPSLLRAYPRLMVWLLLLLSLRGVPVLRPLLVVLLVLWLFQRGPARRARLSLPQGLRSAAAARGWSPPPADWERRR